MTRESLLDKLQDGYKLSYDAKGGWEKAPYKLTSGGGGIIYRASRADLESAADDPEFGAAIQTALREGAKNG